MEDIARRSLGEGGLQIQDLRRNYEIMLCIGFGMPLHETLDLFCLMLYLLLIIKTLGSRSCSSYQPVHEKDLPVIPSISVGYMYFRSNQEYHLYQYTEKRWGIV
jgi:hypothetical protein